MSLHNLVKFKIRVLQVNGSWNCEPKKHTKINFFYKIRTILMKFGTYFPD